MKLNKREEKEFHFFKDQFFDYFLQFLPTFSEKAVNKIHSGKSERLDQLHRAEFVGKNEDMATKYRE